MEFVDQLKNYPILNKEPGSKLKILIQNCVRKQILLRGVVNFGFSFRSLIAFLVCSHLINVISTGEIIGGLAKLRMET
jgi:hypothetical protein